MAGQGRTIPVMTLSQQRDQILCAAQQHDANAMKAAQPMFNDDKKVPMTSKTWDPINAEIGLPPCHFRCRATTTVADLAPQSAPKRPHSNLFKSHIFKVHRNIFKMLTPLSNNLKWSDHHVDKTREKTKKPILIVTK